jgi:hypothetical protein
LQLTVNLLHYFRERKLKILKYPAENNLGAYGKERNVKGLADAVIEGNKKQGNEKQRSEKQGNEKQGSEKPVEELAQKLSMKGVDAYNAIVK